MPDDIKIPGGARCRCTTACDGCHGSMSSTVEQVLAGRKGQNTVACEKPHATVVVQCQTFKLHDTSWQGGGGGGVHFPIIVLSAHLEPELLKKTKKQRF